MAGICGAIGLEPGVCDTLALEGMIRSMEHRGKMVGRLHGRDARFAYVGDQTPSIWPPAGQGFPSEICVVLDGRIDNAQELAAELAREGHRVGAGEARLLACGFMAHGADFLSRIHGSIVAAVHDPESGKSWLIRDPLGMRPLYLYRSRSFILFASELRALLADPTVRVELDPEQLRVLLALGFNPAPHTLLKGIHKMPPGHFVEVKNGGPKNISYDRPVDNEEIDISFEEAVETYRTILQGVVRRSGTDKTGILLSGGADSSALLLLRAREGRSAATFTAGFPDIKDGEDERMPAWEAARALGTLHRERLIELDEIGSLFHAVARVAEEPVAAAWMPTFFRLLEVPAGQVSTLWSGQGAGALHGEGDQWRWLQWGEWVAGLPESVGGFVGGVARRVGGVTQGSSKSRLLSVREERERILSSFFLFEDSELDRLLRAGHLGDRQTVRRLLDRWREPVAESDPLTQGLYICRKTHLPDAVFLPAERLASELGLNLRFPYADPEIVHWLERLPAAYRLDGKQGKRLHREALGAWLPAEVLTRPKRDLGHAVRRWLQGEGQSRVADWLLGSKAWLPSVLDGVRVRSVIDSMGQERTRLDQVILLIQLELWARRMFLDEIG